LRVDGFRDRLIKDTPKMLRVENKTRTTINLSLSKKAGA